MGGFVKICSFPVLGRLSIQDPEVKFAGRAESGLSFSHNLTGLMIGIVFCR
jgi:hypothetical protein